MNLYWPILLAVGSNVFYNICTKSMPEKTNPLASLIITYLIGAAVSMGLFFILNPKGNLQNEFSQLNWTSFVLGIAIVGLEMGSIYMYKAGWNINTGFLVQSVLLAAALLIVGFLLYKEAITWTKVAGIAICIVGMYFINK